MYSPVSLYSMIIARTSSMITRWVLMVCHRWRRLIERVSLGVASTAISRGSFIPEIKGEGSISPTLAKRVSSRLIIHFPRIFYSLYRGVD